MAKDKALIITPQGGEIGVITPAEVVTQATEQAKLLMDIVERRGLFQEIQGKKYLEVEAWQTIGAFNRIHAETDWVKEIKDVNDVIVGYEAQVSLWKDSGAKAGQAILPCGLDDYPCRGREGMAKHKAAKSAAQTWAESKAYRMNFGYVAVLAGYEPTPVEEMRQDKAQTESKKDSKVGNILETCPKHNAPWQSGISGKPPYHRVKGGGICGLGHILDEQYYAAIGAWNCQPDEMDQGLQARYGAPWNKLSIQKKVEVLKAMAKPQAERDSPPEEAGPPLDQLTDLEDADEIPPDE